MGLFKCIMCSEALDLEEDEVEYDEEENVWCSACFITESDGGNIEW